MTMMVHYLLRLHGDEDWDAWGDDWENHADILGELRPSASLTAPSWMNDRPYRQLDWGAFLYEVTMEEVRRLTRHDPHLRFRRGTTYLRDDDRYGIVWMECY